ncbi:phosphoglycerate mutase-like protein [Clavulina sp. PMI_390]|nr:phosphoglycerate mutase-like protein [Clavulina sp. PMI_390]
MASKILHLTRHAQAEHNVDDDYSIPDAPLTALGREQSAKLNSLTAQNIQQTADLLVSSPLSRTLQTTILGFPALRAKLEADLGPTKGIIPLSRLQEVNSFPCDTGRDRAELEQDPEFVGIDFSSLEDDWNSKRGDFDPYNIQERAKWVRKWLRARPEKEIVVVAHGDFLRRLTGTSVWNSWANAEVRQYTFASEDDEDAKVIQIQSEVKTGEPAPTSGDMSS